MIEFSVIQPPPRIVATIMGDNETQSGQWVSDESVELSSSTSVTLQSTMAKGWEKVLRRRAVARLGAARSSRSRAYRRSKMTARRNLVLGERGDSQPCVAEPSAGLVTCAISVASMGDESEVDTEDEPLIRRVVSGSETSQSSDDSQSSDEDDAKEEDSQVGESEREGSSEEESDSGTESDDAVEFLGEESALSRARSQGLLSRWVMPIARAVEI